MDQVHRAWRMARIYATGIAMITKRHTPLHFVILSQYYTPEIGAPQARLSELARRIVARGHRVTVLTAMPNYPTGRIHDGYGGLTSSEVLDGVRVVRCALYPSKSLRTLPRLLSYLSFVFSSVCIGLARVGRADYVMVESPPLFLGFAGWILSRAKRARMIFNVSDLWPDSVLRLGKLRERSTPLRLALAVESFCYQSSWMISGQSHGILDNIGQRFPQTHRFLLTNGVDPNLFSPERRCAERRLSLSGGRSVLALYAGLHGLAQGLANVLDAAVLVRDLTDLAIVFIGDGPLREELQVRANGLGLDNVRFLPPASRVEMPEIVASADICIAPLGMHLPGAIPSKIYEGMGSGVAVLLVADGEPARLVERTGCGLVVPMDDAPALAAAMRRLYSEPGLRATLGDRGRQAALTEFNRDTIVARFIDYLEIEGAR